MFGELYRMGEAVAVQFTEAPIYCAAAKGDGKYAVMLTNFLDDDSAPTEKVKLSLSGLEGVAKAEIITLDNENDATVTKELKICASDTQIELDIPLYNVIEIRIS
jgi:hypothetical protein